MNTLTTEPVRPILDRLFRDSETTMVRFRRDREELEAGGVQRDSAEFKAILARTHLAIAPETGTLLYLLTRSHRPRTIVEFGTSFGVSTLHLAAGLRDNGAGRLITTEIEPTKVAATRQTLADAGLADLVEIREGDALQTLAGDPPQDIDLLFLDGANALYLDLLALVERHLSPSALIVADNANTPGYREYVRGRAEFVSVEVDDRVEVTLVAGN